MCNKNELEEANSRIKHLEEMVFRSNKTWNALADECDAKDERIAMLEFALNKIANVGPRYGDATGCNPQNFCDIAVEVLKNDTR